MPESSLGEFNWLVLIWPVALIGFVVFFFLAYHKDMKAHQVVSKKKKIRITTQERPRLSLLGRPGRMSKRDWFFALVLTFVYSVMAFSFSGTTSVPQTFWRATQEQPSLTLDLGEKVLVDNIIYYAGLGDGNWLLELSADGETWREHTMSQSRDYCELFNWKIPLLDGHYFLLSRYLRLTADNAGMELGELALMIRDENGRRMLDAHSLAVMYPEYAALFDEQFMVPDLPKLQDDEIYEKMYSQYVSLLDEQSTIPALPNMQNNEIYEQNWGMLSGRDGMYFDEVEQAGTAYEFIRNLPPTELTHPPLGKVIIALGINLFGMTPFGWRFMGILFGVLMVPLLYVFVKNLFDNTTVAACGAALFAFENMHFTQTHLATIDAYVVFFIIAMYLFMYRYISSGYETPFIKTLPPLLLCGLSFGLSVASKWTGFYAAAGLMALYVVYLVKRGKHQIAAGQRKEFRSFLYLTLSASAACFVLLPFVIYTLSYIPFTTANEQPLIVGDLIRDMWNNSKYIMNYHSSFQSGHLYPSRWWTWLLDLRPMPYLRDGSRTIIAAFTNPLITIGGLVAIAFALYESIRKRVKAPLVIVIGYLAQLVPWIPISRDTFAYHYFPSMIFLVLALCYVFNNILERVPEHKWRLYAFTGASVGLFFLLLPPTAGIPMPEWYSVWFVRWLPSWPL